MGTCILLVLGMGWLAGCAAPAAPDPAPEPVLPGPPPEVEVALDDCDILEPSAVLPPEQVRPHVPEDFDLVLTAGQATVLLGGLVCDGGRASARGLLAVQVVPRDPALVSPRATNYFWEPEHLLVEGAALTAAMRSVRALAGEARAVEVAFSGTDARLVIDAGPWRHEAASAPGAPGPGAVAAQLPPFREYSAAEGGYAYLDAGFGAPAGSTSGAGAARVTTGEGTVARTLLGPEATLPAVHFAGVAYTDARVGFVPRAASQEGG